MAYALVYEEGVCHTMKRAYAIRPYPNQAILPQLDRSLPQPLDLYHTKGEAKWVWLIPEFWRR
jgi:hypothetical protein